MVSPEGFCFAASLNGPRTDQDSALPRSNSIVATTAIDIQWLF